MCSRGAGRACGPVVCMAVGIIMLPAARAFDEELAHSLPGWFAEVDRKIFETILAGMQGAGDVGPIAEIGVHMGASYVHLLRSAPPGQPVVALDVFEDQAHNYDRSGRGSRPIFERNVRKVFQGETEKLAQMVVQQANSIELRPQDVMSLGGGRPFKFFHIDGCHTYNCTMSDLQLGEAVLDSRGVLVVDDVGTYKWPGVDEALGPFLQRAKGKRGMALLVLTAKKAYLCRRHALPALRARLWAKLCTGMSARNSVAGDPAPCFTRLPSACADGDTQGMVPLVNPQAFGRGPPIERWRFNALAKLATHVPCPVV